MLEDPVPKERCYKRASLTLLVWGITDLVVRILLQKNKKDGPDAGHSDAAKSDAGPSVPSKECSSQSTNSRGPSSSN